MAADGAAHRPRFGVARGFLVNLLVSVLALAVAFGLGEIVVRVLFKDSTVLFPRYHTDYRYGPYILRGNRANAEFWHTSVDGSWRFITNSRGFRDAREFGYSKPKDVVRVLSIGDSHTQGHEVRQEATYSAVLERYLNHRGIRAEVLNAGVSGFSTAEEVAFFENEGIRYDPDVVVLGFYANDFQDNLKAGLFSLQGSHLLAVKREHVPGVGIQNVLYHVPGTRWLSENSYFYSLLFNNVWQFFKTRLGKRSRADQRASDDAPAVPHATFELAVAADTERSAYEVALATALIERLQKFCRERGIRLIVVDIPARAGRYEFRSSLPQPMVKRLKSAGIEQLGSSAYLEDFSGAAELHVPNGYHHISELTHTLIGIELGRRLVAGPNIDIPACSNRASGAAGPPCPLGR